MKHHQTSQCNAMFHDMMSTTMSMVQVCEEIQEPSIEMQKNKIADLSHFLHSSKKIRSPQMPDDIEKQKTCRFFFESLQSDPLFFVTHVGTLSRAVSSLPMMDPWDERNIYLLYMKSHRFMPFM